MPRADRRVEANASYHVTMRCNDQAVDLRRPLARKVFLFCLARATATRPIYVWGQAWRPVLAAMLGSAAAIGQLRNPSPRPVGGPGGCGSATQTTATVCRRTCSEALCAMAVPGAR